MDVGKLLMKASDDLSVRRAFGAAYEKDDMLIIPVAMVAGGGGGGVGRPRQRDLATGPDSVPEGGPGNDPAPQDSGRMDAGGAQRAGARGRLRREGRPGPLGRSGHDDRRAGLAQPGAIRRT